MNDRTAVPLLADRLPLGACWLDLSQGELIDGDGEPARLRPQALEVLLLLGRRAGQVVGKDELMDRVWPGLVVGETSLARAISDIRQALGDVQHRMVRNVARRGYVLVPGPAAPRAPTPPLSIAVLPLRAEGPLGEWAGFVQALHADLVRELSNWGGSAVVARDTVLRIAERGPVDPREVATELNVRHVVLGRALADGDGLRVDLSLVDGATAVQRLAETFRIDRGGRVPTPAGWAVRLHKLLIPALFRAELGASTHPPSSKAEAAERLVLRVATMWYRGLSDAVILEATALLDEAIALDPTCVRAWGNVALVQVNGFAMGVFERGPAARRLDEAAARLEALEGGQRWLPQIRTYQAYLHGDWPAMLAFTTRWKDSTGSGGYFPHGVALMLNGRPDEAAEALETGLELSPRDPLSSTAQYYLAFAHFMAGRDDLAVEWGHSSVWIRPTLKQVPVHAAALARMGQHEAAQRAFDDHMARHPSFTAADVPRLLHGDVPALRPAQQAILTQLAGLGLR